MTDADARYILARLVVDLIRGDDVSAGGWRSCASALRLAGLDDLLEALDAWDDGWGPDPDGWARVETELAQVER